MLQLVDISFTNILQTYSEFCFHSEMTTLDNQILAVIRQNPAVTVVKMATLCSAPLPTVRKHIKKMEQDSIISRGFRIERLPDGFRTRAFIAIDFDLKHLDSPEFGYSNQRGFIDFVQKKLFLTEKYLRFVDIVRIDAAEVLLGAQADAFILVSCRNQTVLFEFVTNCLRYLPGVGSTHTASLQERDG
jgi:DNA-binding Lrp family transcriptional regulator